MKEKKTKVPKRIIITRIILLIFIIIWAATVFNFSSQNGEESSGVSRKVVEIFVKEETAADKIEPYVRKFAHFSEYGLGGALFISLFSTYEWTDRKKITMAIVLGIWYAGLDEIHQLMVPARHGSIVDVYIDTLGFMTGVFSMLLLIKLVKK